MHIHLNLNDGVPIYRQIVNQVKYLIASGQLLPEEELPPIRTLAERLTVTPNTVVRAYRELETEKVIYKRRGAGTYVSDGRSPLARKEQRRILAERADQLLSEARQLKFPLDDVIELLRERHGILGSIAPEEASHERSDEGGTGGSSAGLVATVRAERGARRREL